MSAIPGRYRLFKFDIRWRDGRTADPVAVISIVAFHPEVAAAAAIARFCEGFSGAKYDSFDAELVDTHAIHGIVRVSEG